MDRIDIGPPAAVKVQVVFDGGPTGNPGEQPFIIHPKSTAEVTLKQICALFEIEDHYSHFGLYNNETGREVYSTGFVKDSDALRLKPLPAQKFISRAEVIISKSPAMASKALKHLNDHFIILATSSNNYNVVGNKGTMVVDSVFVSPFLIETIVKVIITKPHFVDLLVRLVNFPKIRVALSSSFLGNARRAITPATFSPPPSSPLPFASLAPPSPLPFAFPPPSQSPNISPSPSFTDLQFQEGGDSSISHSSSHEELSRIRAGMLGNSSNLDLQELEASACPPSPSSALLFSSFAYTSSIRAPTPFDQPNTQSKHSRDLGTRKLDVFTLVRDTLTNARLPTPFTDFFRYLLSDKMNEGIVTRCVLLLNCMLGIAELTVVWGDVDESDLAGLPSEITSNSNKSKPSLDVSGEFLEGSSYGVRSSGAANRYVAFKHGIRSAGIIEALTKYVLQENPIAPLRSAISGFHDHLLRPLDMLALGALDYRKHSHGKLLEQIWWAAFPNSTYPGHLADDWRFIGFRGNPFLTPSHTLISIHAFAHFARNNTKIFREILIEQSELSFSKKGFPLGALAAHLSSMLINFYQLGILRRDPRLIKYLFGPDPSELFYRLFNMLIMMMHEMWRRAGFSFAQFLQSVRIMKNILQRAHTRDPPDLATLEGFIRQFIEEDFPENDNSHPRILLKRSTFVLEDKEEEEEGGNEYDDHPNIMNGSPRIYLREDELWRKKSDDVEDEDDGAEKGNKKTVNNNPRLERFFGEAPEEGYQFAPQPPNVKMVKLKRIFGESVEPNGSPGMDPEVKEYNKRYRDSLNEDEIKKLEVERAHRLHAFFGEWFDTTDANRTIKHTKKPSLTSPDITDLVVIRKISMPPPKAPSSSSSLLSDAVPTIHLSVQPANDFTSSPDVSAPQTQTLSLSLNPLFSDSPCASPRSNPSSPRSNSPSPRNDVLEQSVIPELTITAPDSNVSPTGSGSSSPASPPPELIMSEHIDIKTSNESNNSTESFENEHTENTNNNTNENNEKNNNNEHDTHEKHVDYSDTGSSSSSTPVIHPSPILSPLGRLSSTPASEDYSSSPPSSFSSPSTSPPASIASMASVSMSLPSLPMMPSSLIPHTSSSPPVSRYHNKGADNNNNNNNPWRPALNRTTSAPLNNVGNRSRAGAKRFETAIGTRNHNPLHHLRNDETASSSSIADDSASYISNTDIEIGDDTRPRSNSGGKLSFFRLSRWFSKSGNDSSRPPSPSSNKRLKRNILKQLFGDRINKDLTDLMNEPSIQHEKTASTTRRDRHRPSNNALTPSASSSSVSSSYSSHSSHSHSSQNNNNNNSSLSSSSAPSSANSTPQHSPTTLRPGSPNTRSVSPGRPVSPSRPASPGSPRGESEVQALTRFRFMNRMKSKSSTSIPMASGHTPSPPTSPAATPSKRYHTFSIRKPSPYLQVYQI